MDSILQILKYIFQTKHQESNFDSIDSFFEDGVSFPTFISLIFNGDKIPDIIDHPETDEDKESNNDNALQYLLDKNEAIAETNPKYESSEDKLDLLESILTKQCYTLDHTKIYEICSSLLQPLEITFESEDELIDLENLIPLLTALTSKKPKFTSDEDEDIDELLEKKFKKAKVPLVINSETFDDQNPFNFYIQIEIMFDLFLDKTKYNISEERITLEEIPKSKKKSKFWSFIFKKSQISDVSSDTTEYLSDEEDEKENEDMQSEALLKTINAIGSKSSIQFNDIESAVKNDAIPKFVMNFFGCDSIKDVHIHEDNGSKSRIISTRLTEEQIKNIEAVIEFVKTKKEKFKILLFDFKDIKNLESSTILFYSNFLNCFFIKKLKQEMYQRTARLLCTHTDKFNEKYNSLLFTKYKIYPCLLHFIKKGNLHFDFDYHKKKFTDKEVEPFFKEANVPMIINRDLLIYSKKYVSFPIFYQLQFIFDALDNRAHKSCSIVEALMTDIFLLKNIKVPKFSEMATSIKAKQISLKYQGEMSNKYRKQNEETEAQSYIKKEKNVINKPKTFNDVCNDEKIEEMKKLIQSNKSKDNSEIEIKQFDEFWNVPDPSYCNDEGIIFNKDFNQKNKSNTDWANAIASLQTNTQQKERKGLTKNKSDEVVTQSLMFNRRKSGAEPKLYKLFIYNEQLNKWEFNSNNFTSFSEDKKITVKDSKTPVILFFNSYEDDLVTINDKLINTIYPNLDKGDQDEIFIYALCDRSLTMLNFIVDFSNAEKASIKPIFLLLHVPKSKKNHPHIRLIVTQICSFLSTVCDFEVTVLNSNYYLDQIEFVKNVLKIGQNSGLMDQIENGENNKSPPFSFTIQPPSSSSDFTSGKIDKNKDDKTVEFIFKKPKFVFLVNDTTIQFNSEIETNLKNNDFFTNLVSKIDTETHLHYINVNNGETYEAFLKCMNDIIMEKCCFYWELSTNLTYINDYNFSESYLQMIIKDDYIEDLERLVVQRLMMLKSNEEQGGTKIIKTTPTTPTTTTPENVESTKDKKSKDKKSTKDKKSKDKKSKDKENDDDDDNDNDNNEEKSFDSDFDSEIKKAFPPKNNDLSLICMSIQKFFDHSDCCNDTLRKILKENLKISSDSNLTYIDQYINQKYFWKYQQMAEMVDSHKKFLKKEFLCMVQRLVSEDLFEDTFEFNFDIVVNQLKRDQVRIMQIMQPFIDKINTKNLTKIQDLRNSMKEGTNYAMKETENLREVKVAVQIDGNLKDEIKQDF